MEDILRDYESFECLSLEITKMTSDMQDLLDMYDNLNILQKVWNHFSTESAQIFISERFSLEADTAANQQANTAKAEDPTTGGAVSKNDPNKDGKNNSAAGSGIWKRLGGLKERISGMFKGMQQKCRQFWDKAISYATELTNNLSQKANDIAKSQNNLNYQVSGVCEDINNVQLTPVFAQLQGTRTKDEIGRIVGDLNNNLASKIIKQPQTVSKDDFVNKFLMSYAAANKRVGSERKAASTMFENTAKQTEQAKDQNEMTLREQQANASMSVSNTVIGYIFKHSVKLLGIATKGMKKNG